MAARPTIETPIVSIPWRGQRQILVKDESHCPTGTFKDRLAAALRERLSLRPLDARDLTVAGITMGNTIAGLLTFLGDLDGVSVVGVFPRSFRNRTVGPDTSGLCFRGDTLLGTLERHGAVIVEANLRDGFLDSQKLEALVRETGRARTNFLDVSYGIGEPAYEPILAEALAEVGSAPDYVIVPVGAGVLFREFVDYLELRGHSTTVIGVSVTSEDSIADKLYGYYSPFFEDLCRRGVAEVGRHRVTAVDDVRIRAALDDVREAGLSAEPSAAAAFSVIAELPVAARILVLNTGNGLIWGNQWAM